MRTLARVEDLSVIRNRHLNNCFMRNLANAALTFLLFLQPQAERSCPPLLR